MKNIMTLITISMLLVSNLVLQAQEKVSIDTLALKLRVQEIVHIKDLEDILKFSIVKSELTSIDYYIFGEYYKIGENINRASIILILNDNKLEVISQGSLNGHTVDCFVISSGGYDFLVMHYDYYEDRYEEYFTKIYRVKSPFEIEYLMEIDGEKSDTCYGGKLIIANRDHFFLECCEGNIIKIACTTDTIQVETIEPKNDLPWEHRITIKIEKGGITSLNNNTPLQPGAFLINVEPKEISAKMNDTIFLKVDEMLDIRTMGIRSSPLCRSSISTNNATLVIFGLFRYQLLGVNKGKSKIYIENFDHYKNIPIVVR